MFSPPNSDPTLEGRPNLSAAAMNSLYTVVAWLLCCNSNDNLPSVVIYSPMEKPLPMDSAYGFHLHEEKWHTVTSVLVLQT